MNKQPNSTHKQWVTVGTLALLSLGLGILMPGRYLPFSAKAQAQYAPPPLNGNIYQTQAMAAQQPATESIMIILDSSYSMSEPLGGRGGENKMAAAKRTVLDVLRNIPPTTRVGFRIYGNSSNTFTACTATSLLVPLGQNNHNLIAARMLGVRPTGATPISYTIGRSLQEDFAGVGGKKSIILVSDGMETCGEDPCNVAVRMQQMGANVKISVVGLGLQDYAATKQLRCIALATKGQFYTANTAAELANSLNKAVAAETKVQGTILTPLSSVQTIPQSQPMTLPASNTSPKAGPNPKTYQDKELPAAVPIKR